MNMNLSERTNSTDLLDVLTFGETMLRFTPPGHQRLSQATAFDVWIAGSESNMAVALAALGRSVSWVSRLPDNAVGRKVEAALRACSVNVDHIVWTPSSGRVGTFYAERGAPPRADNVIYDRAGSSASTMLPGDIPDEVFDRHRHVHVSGITLALSSVCANTAAQAIDRARAKGKTISFDVNYRAKLWSPEAAAATLAPMIEGVDVLFCSRDDAERLFGLRGSDKDRASSLRDLFKVGAAIVTGGSDGAAACTSEGTFVQNSIPVQNSIERYGSGDAFAGGFLAMYLENASIERCLALGAAAAALKRTILGDMLLATRAEIEAVLSSGPNASWR